MSTPGYSDDREALLRRLRRIEGQVRGLAGMVERDQLCLDIITQVAAATRSLEEVSLLLLRGHLRHCIADAVAGGEDAQTAADQAHAAVTRLVRS